MRLPLHVALLASFPFFGCTCDEAVSRVSGSLAIEPSPLDFGGVPRSATKKLIATFRNVGTYPLSITDVAAEAPFSVESVGTTLAPGGSVDAQVSFTPTTLGPLEGSLVVHVGSEAASSVLIGHGIEAAVLVEPATVDFGEVNWVSGLEPIRRSVSVTNTGSDRFDVQAIEWTTESTSAFALEAIEAVRAFEPGESSSFDVVLVPRGWGELSGSVRIRTNAPNASEILVPIMGHIVGPRMEICAAKTGSPLLCTRAGQAPRVSLGNLERNATAQGTIQVQNLGDRELIVASIFTTGRVEELSFVPALPTSSAIALSPDQSTTVEVSYQPTDYTFDATVVGVASNDPRGSRSVVVEGGVRRPRIRVVPTSLTFSQVSGSQARASVRIFSCGEQTLILSRVELRELSGPGSAFGLSGVPASVTSIEPRAGCENGPPGVELTVTFAADANGQYTAEVMIESNDPVDPTVSVQLLGTRT
ncbi:MAG: choice-of-anchor D domain-containing protein [Deltaproteobacteria bacterium]|nr:choice-of-anchor D domain-containing protein [Deltaproteobacteria bacterium]